MESRGGFFGIVVKFGFIFEWWGLGGCGEDFD